MKYGVWFHGDEPGWCCDFYDQHEVYDNLLAAEESAWDWAESSPPGACYEVRKYVTPVTDLINEEIAALGELLLRKNAAYGNSAFEPLRVFSKADAIEQINVRIDDKLSRIARGTDAGEDTELDLIGYLILKRVARRYHERSAQ